MRHPLDIDCAEMIDLIIEYKYARLEDDKELMDRMAFQIIIGLMTKEELIDFRQKLENNLK